jgi:hypothetical protein
MTPTITAFERSPDRGKGQARDMRVRWALEEVGQPATLTGVRGRPTRASAFSTDSERPRCSDQPKESSAAHANVEAAIATVVRLICFMAFLRYLEISPLKHR